MTVARWWLLLLLVQLAVAQYDEEPQQPTFLVTPLTDYYIAKSKMLTLECRARYASSVHAECNGKELGVSKVIPASSSSTTQTDSELVKAVQWNVTYDDVHEFSSDETLPFFSCECLAWPETSSGNLLPVRTNQTRIQVAYLRNIEWQEPRHKIAPADSLIQLQCTAPEGKPKPETFWFKNDAALVPEADSNLISCANGSLIIRKARHSDSGLYSCVSQNLAGRRQTPPVNLTVFADGRWSEWTPWIPPACVGADCDGQFFTRNRQCMEPKNGGRPCNGLATERRPYTAICGDAGGWSWSVWSTWGPPNCDENCKQSRQRVCEAKPGCESGRQSRCDGQSNESRHCEHCFDSPQDPNQYSEIKKILKTHSASDSIYRSVSHWKSCLFAALYLSKLLK